MKREITPLARAYRWISAKPHSEWEMRCRLRDYASEKETAAIIDRLLALKLLDDLNFSAGFASYRLRELHQGPLRIRSELLQRGVAEDVIDKALDVAATETSVEDAVRKAAEKLLRHKAGSLGPKEYRRIVGRLLRAGFPAKTVKKAMGRLDADEIDWSIE